MILCIINAYCLQILCNKNVILTLQIIVFDLNEELVDKKKANKIQNEQAPIYTKHTRACLMN